MFWIITNVPALLEVLQMAEAKTRALSCGIKSGAKTTAIPEQTTLWVQALGCQETSSSWRYRDGEEAAAPKELLEAPLLPKEKGDVKKRDRHIKPCIFRRNRKASSASSCFQGFGVLQPRRGSHGGSCWGWDLRGAEGKEEGAGRWERAGEGNCAVSSSYAKKMKGNYKPPVFRI